MGLHAQASGLRRTGRDQKSLSLRPFPYIQRTGLTLDRVMLCWDGSRSAARAAADALPFIRLGNVVEVVMVANEAAKSDEMTGADIAHHLARHGAKVELKRIVTTETDVANIILSHAADTSADFLVMGGYGHSRLREFILGGVTRGILGSMTVPTCYPIEIGSPVEGRSRQSHGPLWTFP